MQGTRPDSDLQQAKFILGAFPLSSGAGWALGSCSTERKEGAVLQEVTTHLQSQQEQGHREG